MNLNELKFASEPIVSNDGNLVACVVAEVAQDQKSYTSGIYLSRDDQEVRRLTSGKHKDAAPRFSPDGSQMVFTRVVDGKPQLFVLPLSGGEPRQLTNYKAGVSSPAWSNDGSRVAFLSRGDWVDEALQDGQPRVVEDLRYKSNGIGGAGLLPSEPLALYVLELEQEKSQIISNHPTDIESYAWLPDGWGLVFTAARDKAQAARWGAEVFLLMLGKKKPRRLRACL